MILRIEFAYNVNEIIISKGRADYLRVRETLSGLVEMYDWPEDKDKPDYVGLGGSTLIVTEQELAIIHELQLPYGVKNFKHGYWDSKPNGKDVLSGNVTNIHIAIPNIGLLMIDEVTYHEDMCTNALQSELDDGWRILAICPPNGDRRPTYILGRKKPA